jgi:hypothetical protein
MSVLEGEMTSSPCTNVTGSDTWIDTVGVTQEVMAHGAPQVPIIAQPLKATLMGPNNTQGTNTLLIMVRRHVMRLTSALLAC